MVHSINSNLPAKMSLTYQSSIARQLEYKTIRNIDKLYLSVIYIHISFLVIIDLYNYLNGIWEKFPSQYYVFLNHLMSIPVLFGIRKLNTYFLEDIDSKLRLPYKWLYVFNIASFIPFILVYYYWDLLDYNSSGIFIIYIFVLGFLSLHGNKSRWALSLYLGIVYFGMIRLLNISYLENPSLFLNGIAALFINVFVSGILYDQAVSRVFNELALEESNIKLKALNSELYKKNKEKTDDLKEKLIQLSNVIDISDRLSKTIEQMGSIAPLEKRHIQKQIAHLREPKELDDLDIQFMLLHEDFHRTLMTLHPDITPNNIKLCIYLKMGLSTKEIANLKSQSADSVKVARSRLRKKLNLPKGANLHSYLNTL